MSGGEWYLRNLEERDLDAAVQLWEAATSGPAPLSGLSEVFNAVRAGEPAVAAIAGEVLVGTAVAGINGDRARILRLAVAPDHRARGIGGALLDRLLDALEAAGARSVTHLLPEEEHGAHVLESRGFQRRDGVRRFHRELAAPQAHGGEALAELGGQSLPADLWESLAGMEREKSLIERRVILPLARPEQAARHGVRPPQSIVLFGPPGTGKTTFARGVASRLGWPFVELFPSELAVDRADQPSALRRFFLRLQDIGQVVVFIDEIEEIAASRDGAAGVPAVTNELLKLIPVFRERTGRLLVCATNSIHSLDTAFVRPGRFDYLLPVGPPDETARRVIWSSYVRRITDAEVDVDQLVKATSLRTPADIDFIARKAAQAAFERAVAGGSESRASIEDFLTAIAETRPSLTRDVVRAFEQDIEDYARD